MIAVCRLHYCPKTRAYVERRTSEGKTKKDLLVHDGANGAARIGKRLRCRRLALVWSPAV